MNLDGLNLLSALRNARVFRPTNPLFSVTLRNKISLHLPTPLRYVFFEWPLICFKIHQTKYENDIFHGVAK